jgi:CspA family cold shock protein
MTGTIAAFDIKKGFGFVRLDDGSGDALVHFTEILDREPNGFRVLYPDDVVTFDVEETDRGPRAKNCRVLKRAGERS